MKRTKRAALLSLLLPAVIWAAPARADGGGGAEDLWTGFYLGAQAGYQAIVVDPNLCLVNEAGTDCNYASGVDDIVFGGAEVGLYLGYNYRIDPVVIGLELDVNAGFSETSDEQQNFEYDILAGGESAIRARLGMLAGERTLIYATGGPSMIGEEVEITNCEELFDNATCGMDTTSHFGWQLGAGVEYFATDKLSIKAEYLHGWYGKEKMTLAEDETGKIDTENEMTTDTFRVGVAYHFNGL